MKIRLISFLSVLFTSAAAFAAGEGTPVYYQNGVQSGKNANYDYYQTRGYTNYVGQSNQKQIVNSRNYSYQVPRATTPSISGTMTTNGVAVPAETEQGWVLTADYARRFADFQFKTGVNSVLEWDDMIFNEIGIKAQNNFAVRDFDLFAFGEYRTGSMSGGGMSMDYDLEPYDNSDPDYGIFTISVGDQSGKTKNLRLGIGAYHVWDVGGWKLSPSFGYEIFQHNLQMSNHLYPNPATYLPLMTTDGDYVYGDEAGNYYALDVNTDAPDDLYQVCMSPEDMKLVSTGSSAGSGYLDLGTSLSTVDYTYTGTDDDLVPWGVYADQCVIIGGDGIVLVDGTTHIYNTTWSGFYVGLEAEKQMTLVDKLRFYVQFSMPKYSSEGIWPNRDDWQQNPSFIDEGSNGAYSYKAEMEYINKLSDRLQLSLKVDTSYFHVGNIGGELYVAEYTYWLTDSNGQYLLDDNGLPISKTVAAYTETITDSLDSAVWQSFGLHLGLKYSF